jgi:hypothetical protein
MDTLVVAGAMPGAWSDIGGLGAIRVPWVGWLGGLLVLFSFWREFYAEIVFEDQIL